MIQSDYTVRVIQPSEGYTLTQNADVELVDRILSKKVYLAVNDSPENWKEITDAEAQKIADEIAEETAKENNEEN